MIRRSPSLHAPPEPSTGTTRSMAIGRDRGGHGPRARRRSHAAPRQRCARSVRSRCPGRVSRRSRWPGTGSRAESASGIAVDAEQHALHSDAGRPVAHIHNNNISMCLWSLASRPCSAMVVPSGESSGSSHPVHPGSHPARRPRSTVEVDAADAQSRSSSNRSAQPSTVVLPTVSSRQPRVCVVELDDTGALMAAT